MRREVKENTEENYVTQQEEIINNMDKSPALTLKLWYYCNLETIHRTKLDLRGT